MAMPLADFEKLIKFMGMTGSSADGEALNAIRLANNMLVRNNISWEEVLRQKVKVEVQQTAAGGATTPAGSSAPKNASKRSPDSEVDEVVATMESARSGRTDGFWNFIDSVCSQWMNEGWLSQRQWDSLKKSYDRQSGRGTPAAQWTSV